VVNSSRFLALTAGIAFLALASSRAYTPRVPVYPTLAANADLVQCGPYDTVASGAAN
jgi:hypothetical protein